MITKRFCWFFYLKDGISNRKIDLEDDSEMKVLLVGGSGMLGSDCHEVLSQEHEVIAPDKKKLDIISWDGVIEFLHTMEPDVVVNCAGFTDVDSCETEDFLVRKINVEGPRNLAQGSARFNCKLVHISSDYVFSGKKSIPQPYFEDDPADPISAYGKSKMESEVAVRENAPDYVIIRSAWLYGIHGGNFITSILKNTVGKKRKTIKVVNDQFGSPTWTYRLALQINELIKSDAKGTVHATSEGYCTRFDCAKEVFKRLKLKITVKPSSLNDHDQPAKRPANCILENRVLKKWGIDLMPDWKSDLKEFLNKHGKGLVKQARSEKS
jgi:dTDP-4-dehydrorhamnose reductase